MILEGSMSVCREQNKNIAQLHLGAIQYQLARQEFMGHTCTCKPQSYIPLFNSCPAFQEPRMQQKIPSDIQF